MPKGERRKGQPWFRIPPQYQTPLVPDAWTGPGQPRSTYYTTHEMAEELAKWSSKFLPASKRAPYERTVYRWCLRNWFGPLPEGRVGRGHGYRIPPNYLYVARLWHLTEDPEVRKLGLAALVEEESPRPWVVVVAGVASTHYTHSETATRIASVITEAEAFQSPLHAVFVGPIQKGK